MSSRSTITFVTVSCCHRYRLQTQEKESLNNIRFLSRFERIRTYRRMDNASSCFFTPFKKSRKHSSLERKVFLPISCAESFPVSLEQRNTTQVPLRIIIAGAPASGKGTQCKKIAKRYNLVHISTGDMLREAIIQGTELGRVAKGYMDRGELVPDHVVIDMLQRRLEQDDCKQNGWLLDGFPRTVAQAQALEQANIFPDLVLVLDVPESDLIERVVGRRLDPVTGHIYHIKYSPPDICIAGRLIQRSDDTEEMVRIRLSAYQKHIDAIEQKFPKVIHINGSRSAEEVFSDIVHRIECSHSFQSETGTSMQPNAFIVLGVPGSNKTEYAWVVVRKTNSVLCDISALFVDFLSHEKGSMREVVRKSIESGKLVPDEIVLKIVEDFLCRNDCHRKRVVFCGFPRTLTQIEYLKKRQFCVDQVLLVDVPDEVTVPNLLGKHPEEIQLSKFLIGHNLFWKRQNGIPKENNLTYSDTKQDCQSYEVVRRRLSSFYSDWDYIQFAYKGRTHVIYSVDAWQYNVKRIDEVLISPPRKFVWRVSSEGLSLADDLVEYVESGIHEAEYRMKPIWDSQWNGLISREMLRDGDFGFPDIIYRWDLAILDMFMFYLYFYIQRHIFRFILERSVFYISLSHSIPWVFVSAFYGTYHIRSIESQWFMLQCVRMASKICLPLGILVRGLRFSIGLNWFYILFTLLSLYYTLVTWRKAFIRFDVFLGRPRRRKGYLVDTFLKLYRVAILKRQ
eukprot:jgi/Galph1/6010/GphlegSOOS_G4729.1